jgi:hypothetical protein
MRNRPGRIFYMIDFKGLDTGFITEYCNDNLNAQEHIETICKISQMFDEFNFDMLKALVEEMNRYGETPQEALEMLNAKPEFDGGSDYTVEVIHEGKPIQRRDEIWSGNPLGPKGVSIDYYLEVDDDDEDSSWNSVYLTQEHLKNIDIKNGKFVFGNDNTQVTLTKKKEIAYNYYAF